MSNEQDVARTDDPVVRIGQGTLRGVREEGVRVFRGVPFAAAPVGPYRFRPPRPPRPWSGERTAAVAGPASYQLNSRNEKTVLRLVEQIDPGVPGVMAWPPYTNATYRQENASEDCLYLDIWVPDHEPDERLPVYVYYHGGANAVSSGSFVLERGARLARTQRIIVVRPNYRMGALGWLHIGLLVPTLSDTVNLGVRDQVAALRWVSENIAAFGGDPDQVAVGGESAGGTAVSHLLGIPSARRLFRRAIIQSLSPFNPWCTQQRAEAETVVRLYTDLLGLDSAADLVHVDADRLLAVANILTRWFPADAAVAWRPLGGVVDGDWIAEAPARELSGRPPDIDDIQVTIGFAQDEWLFFRGHTDTIRRGDRDDALAVLAQIVGPGAPALYERFAALRPDHAPGRLLSDVMSAVFFKYPSIRIAENLAAHDVPVRVFQFCYELPGLDGAYHAPHTGDIPFLFGNHTDADLACWPTFTGIDRDELAAVSAQSMDLYGKVIRGEDPGPSWPRFTVEERTVLRLARTLEPHPGLLDGDTSILAEHGLPTVADLEARLVRNLRDRLKTPVPGPPEEKLR